KTASDRNSKAGKTRRYVGHHTHAERIVLWIRRSRGRNHYPPQRRVGSDRPGDRNRRPGIIDQPGNQADRDRRFPSHVGRLAIGCFSSFPGLIYSPPLRGGVARQLKRSWRAGREARARAKRKRDSAQPQEKHEASREVRQNRENAGLTTPSAPLWWLRGIFFVAQPPSARRGMRLARNTLRLCVVLAIVVEELFAARVT